MVDKRRSPALTKACRDMFEQIIYSDGWQPGGTIPAIAQEVGLSVSQVRDAIFAPTADEWRHKMMSRHGRKA